MGSLKYVAVLSILQLYLCSLNAQEQGSSDVCPLNMESLKDQFTKSNREIEKNLDEQTAEILEQMKKNDDAKVTMLDLQAKTCSKTQDAVDQISKIITEKFSKIEKYLEHVSDRFSKMEETLSSAAKERALLSDEVKKISESVANLQLLQLNTKFGTFEQKLNSHSAAQDSIFRNLSAEISNAINAISPDCALAKQLDLSTLSTGQYHFSTNFMTWYEAKQFCKRHSMELVTINSKEEANALVAARKVVDTIYWTSASDIGRTPGIFYWGDGKPTERWIWNSVEPDSHGEGKEACALLRSDFVIGDLPCSDKWPLICELHPFCKNK